MGPLRAEILKLKRSLVWPVVIILPLALVFSAAFNTLASGAPLADGWHTLWMRTVAVHGLFPLALGIALIGALVWRADHRGGNGNALMSGPTRSRDIVLAKAAVVALLAAAMQPVLVAGVLVMGSLVLGLPGVLPAEYLAISLLIMIACAPVAALQSGLAMVLRSFAAPVAVGLVGAGASAVALLAFDDAAIVSPYALVSRATQLGTGAFADSSDPGVGLIALLLAVSALLTGAILAVSTAVLDRRDA